MIAACARYGLSVPRVKLNCSAVNCIIRPTRQHFVRLSKGNYPAGMPLDGEVGSSLAVALDVTLVASLVATLAVSLAVTLAV